MQQPQPQQPLQLNYATLLRPYHATLSIYDDTIAEHIFWILHSPRANCNADNHY